MSLFGNKKTEEAKKAPAKKAASASVKEEKKASMKDLYNSGETKSEAEKKEENKSVEAKAAKNPILKRDFRVLKRPLITEKGGQLGMQNKYLFEVAYDTNKIEVAKAIFEAYGVKPVKINIIKNEGKIKRRGAISGQRKNWKKAIVTLPEGKTIQVYEGI